MGLEGQFVRTDNDAEYDNRTQGKWFVDTTKTNHFIYTERIYAAYANVTKVFNKQWIGTGGVAPGKSTQSSGDQQVTTDSVVFAKARNYFTTYIQYTLNDKNLFVLDFGRRIQRPDYGDLNPFKYFLDPYTYQEGNPELKPQFSNNIELTHTYRVGLPFHLPSNYTCR